VADILKTLGSRIRRLRLDRGWRQIDLAHHTGISENYVSDIENGKKEICLLTLKDVSVALDTSLSNLLSGL
jgi:transcriptional regulator with XRE-family HTH domain